MPCCYLKQLLSLIFFSILFLSIHSSSKAAPATNNNIFFNIIKGKDTVGLFEKWQVHFKISQSIVFSNPYDYTQVHTKGVFIRPGGGSDTVDGFYIKNYNEQGNGLIPNYSDTASFEVRYAAKTKGKWVFKLLLSYSGSNYESEIDSFFVGPSKSHGFLKIAPFNHNYINYDDGYPYIVVGENLAWNENASISQRQAYRNWLSKLHLSNANTIRVFMNSFSYSFEWKNQGDVLNDYLYNGLTYYKQTTASNLDWLVDTCQQLGINIVLTFENFTEFSTVSSPLWQDNPYNSSNGGMCNSPEDFFTSTDAWQVYKNKIRYIVARYAYASSIMAWELFNEADLVDNYSENSIPVEQWHAKAFSFLNDIDHFKHLRTTSFGNYQNDDNIWKLNNLDFTTIHLYDSSDFYRKMTNVVNDRVMKGFNKPVLFEEFGLFVNLYTNHTSFNFDSTGSSLHNGLFASYFNGIAGGAMHWEWQSFIDSLDLYNEFYRFRKFVSYLPSFSSHKSLSKSFILQDQKKNISSVFIYPSAPDYLRSPDSLFVISDDGVLSPICDSIRPSLMGSWGGGDRMPPHFYVNFNTFGFFSVAIKNASTQYSSLLAIYVDDSLVLMEKPKSNGVYTISVSPGLHNIKVDNLGDDAFSVFYYKMDNVWSTFRNVSSTKNLFVLPILSWGNIGSTNIELNADNSITPNADSLSKILYANWSDYYAPPSFNGYYASAGSATVTLDNSINGQSPQRLQVFLDSQKVMDSLCVINRSYTIQIPKGRHAVRYEITGNWVSVKSYSFQGIDYRDSSLQDSSYIDLYPQNSWGQVSDTIFQIDAKTGIINPSLNRMNNILYGLGGNDSFRQPYNITALFNLGSYMVLRTTAYNGGTSIVQISLDNNKVLWQQEVSPSSSYKIPINIQGYHGIRIDNIGTNGSWIQIASVSLSNIAPSLNGYTVKDIIKKDSSDIVIKPLYQNWSFTPVDTFRIMDSTINIAPTPDSLGNILFSKYAQGSTYAKDKVFNVSFPVDGQFWVTTKNYGDSLYRARITFFLDGIRCYNAMADTSSSFGIDIPSGIHQIALSNEGEYAVYLDNYIFKKAKLPFNAYLMFDNHNDAVGWISSKYYNWAYMRDSTSLPVLKNYSIYIPSSGNGVKHIRIYDGQTIQPIADIKDSVLNDTLKIALPTFSKDLLFRTSDNAITDEPYLFGIDTSAFVAGNANTLIKSNNIENIKIKKKNIFLLYPNPAKSGYVFFIIGNSSSIVILDIYSVDGALLMQKKYYNVTAGSENLLNVSSLKSGIYLIKCQDGEKMYSSKLIIIK